MSRVAKHLKSSHHQPKHMYSSREHNQQVLEDIYKYDMHIDLAQGEDQTARATTLFYNTRNLIKREVIDHQTGEYVEEYLIHEDGMILSEEIRFSRGGTVIEKNVITLRKRPEFINRI